MMPARRGWRLGAGVGGSVVRPAIARATQITLRDEPAPPCPRKAELMEMIEALKHYLTEHLRKPGIRSRLERSIVDGSSTAGRRHEEVFTRDFLCPTLHRFFYEHVRSELNLTDEQITVGLGTEGFENSPGFGFTPGHQSNHIFTKSDIARRDPPKAWFAANSRPLPPYQACPDFAIREPLPFSMVGETKYFRNGSATAAVKELYRAARQAVFYLGAFPRRYDAAMIVVGDASPGHTFYKGLESLKPELVQRFGQESNVHLVTAKITLRGREQWNQAAERAGAVGAWVLGQRRRGSVCVSRRHWHACREGHLLHHWVLY